MDSKENGNPSATRHGPEESKDIQKGAWTEEEDSILGEFIQNHGQGHWDLVARCTGLKRTGKSCRLRWLNYLRPGIRHGNFTLEEQLKILCLHLLWGNCWSKIAESLHGRTDNEIKNYWRTRVQRQAKQLNCDVNSKEFRSIIRSVLIPRVAEQIRSESPGYSPEVLVSPVLSSTSNIVTGYCNDKASIMEDNSAPQETDYDDVDVADQVGDDIWNDENVDFLRQQLHGDADI